MTRFFLTLQEAISLLFKAAEVSIGGETFVEKMNAFRLVDLAKAIIEEFGDKNTKIIEIGTRPGEKIDEVLVSRYEVENTYQFDEIYYIILPFNYIEGLKEHYSKLNLKKVDFEEYSSKDYLNSVKEFKDLLKKGLINKEEARFRAANKDNF